MLLIKSDMRADAAGMLVGIALLPSSTVAMLDAS